jgi:TonB family protein
MKTFLCGLLFLVGSVCCAAPNDKDVPKLVESAARKSRLTEPGGQPFHLRLVADDKGKQNSEHHAEIEIWWKSPEKWKRQIKSPVFSQTAIRNGARYYEENSGDYMPWWLYELFIEATDPVPVEELKNVKDVDFMAGRCAKWESGFEKEGQKTTVYNTFCFNPDDTAREIFVRTISAKLEMYRSFRKKRVAEQIIVWPGGTGEVRGLLEVLEELKGGSELFAVPRDTGWNARLQFVAPAESALQLDTERTPPLQWPVVHSFPAHGVMAVNVKIDRSGNVREMGTVVSSNFVLQGPAAEQIKNWKFKPYLVEGVPVQVNTTLTVRYDTKMELLGANGRAIESEPFLDRIKKWHEQNDPRSSGDPPFHLIAGFVLSSGAKGSYEEEWTAPGKWQRHTGLGDAKLSQTSENGKVEESFAGDEKLRPLLKFVANEMEGRLPDRHYSVYEADWGQSAVQFEGEDMVRIARGKVDEKNDPIDGQAYWFDSTGVMRGAFEGATTVHYGNFEDWGNKKVARRMTITKGDQTLLTIEIEKIESMGTIPK